MAPMIEDDDCWGSALSTGDELGSVSRRRSEYLFSSSLPEISFRSVCIGDYNEPSIDRNILFTKIFQPILRITFKRH